MPFVPFPSIEGFHNIRKNVARIRNHYTTIRYRAKVKLHGTNAGIRVEPDSKVVAQSRSNSLVLPNDNSGFAKWAEPLKPEFSKLADKEQITIFGEWCGKGIQKNVAISQINNKIFAPFMIQYGCCDDSELSQEKIIVDPDQIKEILSKINLPDEVVVIPWAEDTDIIMDFTSTEVMEECLTHINQKVLEVENSDPFVKEYFGIEGTGEGLVFVPIFSYLERWAYSSYTFKAKGDKHKVNKNKSNVASQLDPDVLESITEFVGCFATENRFEQAVNEACNGEYNSKLIGPFIGWVCSDIKKESEAELEASGLEWKEISKFLTQSCRAWYLDKIQQL